MLTFSSPPKGWHPYNAADASTSTAPPFQDLWSTFSSGEKRRQHMRCVASESTRVAQINTFLSAGESNSCAAAVCTSVRRQTEVWFGFFWCCLRQSVKDRKATDAAPPTPQFLCFCWGLLTRGKQIKNIRSAFLLAPLRGKRWEWDESEQDGTTQLKMVLFLPYLLTDAGGK